MEAGLRQRVHERMARPEQRSAVGLLDREPAERALAHGQAVPAAGVEGTYGMFDPDGRAVALVRDRGRTAKPVLVITPAG